MSARLGKRGFQKSVDYSEKLNIPLVRTNDDIPEPELSRIHGRTCICVDNMRCADIQRRYVAVNQVNAIGYACFFITKDSVSDKAAHQKYLESKTNVYCQVLGIDSQLLTKDRQFISVSHFPPNYLDAAWSRKTKSKYIEYTLPIDEGAKYGFKRLLSSCKMSTDKLILVEPSYTYDQNESFLTALEDKISNRKSQDDLLEKQQKTINTNYNANIKEIGEWIEGDVGLMSTFERMKNDSGPKLQATLKQCEVLEQELLKKSERINKFILDGSIQGMTRTNISSDEWHSRNPNASTILFRIGSGCWEETKKIFSALWPHIPINVGSGDSPMTEFEKALITRMRMSKAMTQDMLGFIFNRSSVTIGRYIKSWSPKWGAAGMDLSILDISDSLLDTAMPQAYIDKKIDRYPILVDGTDIMKSACRKNAAVKRMEFSDKVNHEAVRGISYTLAMGLTIEHTPLNLARCSEGGLVMEWGSKYKYVPLDPVDVSFMEEDIDDILDCESFTPMFQEISKFGRALSKSQRIISRNRHETNSAYNSDDDTTIEDTNSGQSTARNSLTLDNDRIDSDDEQFQPGVELAMDEISEIIGDLSSRDDLIDEMDALNTSIKINNDGKTYNVVESSHKDYAILKSIRQERLKEGVENSGADLTIESINAYNNQILLCHGPDKDNKHKARQLLRHERLHMLYKSGQLKKCSLSYYLDKFSNERKKMLERLFGHQPSCRHPLNMRTRLAKFSYRQGILADRGFANDACKYPNFNPHLTPCFLAKRRQFMSSEVSKDRDVCTLRYTSEAIFSHVFDEECLKDVVPYTFLHILEDAWNWGHAAANFMQPLRNPKDWNEYLNA